MEPIRTRRPWVSSGRGGRARRTGALLLLVGGVLTVVGPVPASAHSVELGGSTPSADEVVRRAEVIELRFTGPVRTEGASFTLQGLSGVAPTLTPPTFSDDTTSVTFQPVAPLDDDRYRVGYQLTAFDGHPGSGVLEFEVSRDGEARAPAWPTEETSAPVAAQPQAADAARTRPWILTTTGAVIVLLTVVLLRLDRSDRRTKAAAGK